MAKLNTHEIITDVSAVNQQIGVGDGVNQNFACTFAGNQVGVVSAVLAVTRQDWQGVQALYPYARTNKCWPSSPDNAVAGGQWSANKAADMSVTAGVPGPDGVATSATRFTITNAAGSNTCGPNWGSAATFLTGSKYQTHAWVRGLTGVEILGMQLEGSTGIRQYTQLSTNWQRVALPNVTRTNTNGSLTLYMFASTTTPTTSLLPAGAGIEVSYVNVFENDANNGSSISTTTAPATVTDYTYNNGVIRTEFPPVVGAVMRWTGNGTVISFPPPAPSVSDKVNSAITWRYDTSPRLNALLASKVAWYNQNNDQFWQNWFNSVFNLKTANNFGCAVWAYILNVPINVLGLRNNYRLWAFDALRANFSDSTGTENPSSGNFPAQAQAGSITSIQEAIWALRLKYYVHTSPRDVLSINALLADVFEGAGLAYVLDGQDMTMTYTFKFELSNQFQLAMVEYDLLPKVAGVKLILDVSP